MVNFFSAQMLIMRSVIGDGEIFWQPLQASASGKLLARFIGAESVGNSTSPNIDQSRWNDGVMLDQFNKSIQFRVLADETGVNFTDVPADQMHHVFRPHRLGYVRQPSWLGGAAGKIQDIGEIQNYLQQSYKMAAQIAYVITSPDAGRIGMGGALTKVGTTTGGPDVTIDSLYSQSGIPQLKPGEKIDSFKSDHPGTGFNDLIDSMSRDIAWGAGCSPELLWNISNIGGANTRYVMADGQMLFDECQSNILIPMFCRPFFKKWLWNEIENSAGADVQARIPHRADWWRHEWGTPRKATVDFGRDTSMLLKLAAENIISEDRLAGMLGYDLEHEDAAKIERRIMRGKMLEKVAPENPGLTYASVFGTDAERAAEAANATPPPEAP